MTEIVKADPLDVATKADDGIARKLLFGTAHNISSKFGIYPKVI